MTRWQLPFEEHAPARAASLDITRIDLCGAQESAVATLHRASVRVAGALRLFDSTCDAAWRHAPADPPSHSDEIDGPWVLALAVPCELGVEAVLQYFGAVAAHATCMLVVCDLTRGAQSVLVRAKDASTAAAVRDVLQGQAFHPRHAERCTMLPLADLRITGTPNTTCARGSMTRDDICDRALQLPYSLIREIPTCPRCFDRLDAAEASDACAAPLLIPAAAAPGRPADCGGRRAAVRVHGVGAGVRRVPAAGGPGAAAAVPGLRRRHRHVPG